MSELLSQGVESGTLLLICSSDRVSGIWQENDVTVESRFLSRNAGESAIEPLHWLASVLLELRSQREASAPVAPTTAAAVTSTPAPAATADTTSPAPAEPSPSSSTHEPPLATAPPDAKPQVGATQPQRWAISLSALYAHFGTEIPGALGPRAGASYRFFPRFHATAWADARWSVRANEGFGSFEVSTGLGVAYDILPFLALTVAPRLVLTTFSLPEGTMGSRAPVVAGGFVAAVRAKIPLSPARPFLDLGLESASPARQATLAGEPMLTIPTWQVLLAAGIELSL